MTGRLPRGFHEGIQQNDAPGTLSILLMRAAPQLLRIPLLALFLQLSVCAWARQPAAQRVSPNLTTHVENGENSGEEDLILGFRGKSKYQIIVPDQTSTETERESVWRAAELLQTAFGAHGIRLEIKKEPEADQERPSFYLGATNFAAAHGCGAAELGTDSYMHKVVSHHIIIRGDDAPDTLAGKRGRPKETPLPHEGTLFGTAEFLYRFVGARFLSPDQSGTTFLPLSIIHVPRSLNVKASPRFVEHDCHNSAELFYTANHCRRFMRV